MVQKEKINVKERFSDGEVDLSMSNLDEVPVKEIAALRKTTSLDLSNNRLTYLPPNFTILVNLTKLDLSKNELTELPEDFGSLSKLKYLDLYKNNIERLPLGFGQLSALKFLDLKDNPLIPTIAKVAGPCVDTKGCQQCARDVVNFYRRLKEEVDNEVTIRERSRQKQLELNQQKKQEEKKKQKKEKLKKIKHVITPNVSKDSVNATEKEIKQEEEESIHIIEKLLYMNWAVLKWCLRALFALLFCAIIFECPHVKEYLPIEHYYHIFLDKLPFHAQMYLRGIVTLIKDFLIFLICLPFRFIGYLKKEEMEGNLLVQMNKSFIFLRDLFKPKDKFREHEI